MSSCPSCGTALAPDARFCSSCGSIASADVTTPTGSFAAPAGAALDTGTLFAGRYRIVGLLGRGGMGEVYRADDLTLGQSVALKFLPGALATHDDHLRRFYQEVRLAREVAHPNVCRVYDVGEVAGRTYLSMEFVDGEDLASLLRRIGRLPQEKGIELARQLCAGLGALHERGVLHRDLKPANVMIDGRGRVRITDFGLSVAAAGAEAPDARSGTPAYMAPEQIAGEAADRRTDIYALGLILYEMFTGRRAFEADTAAEMMRKHREATPRSASAVLPDLDPAIERVIERCLEKNPAARPPSAYAVAAALPGGDPLAAAIAAGEIPSIELVAASGAAGGVRPWVGAACVAAVVVALVVAATVNAKRRIYHFVPFEKPPSVLAEKAREVLAAAGHDATEGDSEFDFLRDNDVLKYVAGEDSSAARWERLRSERPPGVVFWYRQSPGQLVPWQPEGGITPVDPPMTEPGMAKVTLDTTGRLVGLEVVPPRKGAPAADSMAADAAAFDPLFVAAGLDRSRFAPIEPEWLPPHHADRRFAWNGSYPETPDVAIRVEAALFAGRPVHFAIYGPWSREEPAGTAAAPVADRVTQIVILAIIMGVFGGGVFLALRNLRLGRGDRAGARRISTFVFLASVAAWAVTANHSSDAQAEVNFFFARVAVALVGAALFWSFYLAIEPYVRRTWPERIVGWSRVLTGRWRDPLVGRDILIGGMLFLAMTLLETATVVVPAAAGRPVAKLGSVNSASVLGASHAVAAVLNTFLNAVFNAMFLFLVLLVLVSLVRRERAAIALALALGAALGWFTASDAEKPLAAASAVLLVVIWLVTLLRFGLLAFLAGFFFDQLASTFPVGSDLSVWYAGPALFAMAVILGITLAALWLATARTAPAPARG